MTDQYNTLKSNGFVFAILRLPETVFRLVQLELPSVSVDAASTQFSEIETFFPGSQISFDTFTFRFIVGEDLKNYNELYNWMSQQKFRSDFIPTKTEETFLVSDATLTTLNNSNVANRTFFFYDMFPVSLSGITFETNVSEPTPVECTASFKYSHFELR